MQKPFNFVTQLYLPYLRISRSLFVKSTITIAHGLFPKVHPSLPLLADKIQKSSSFFRETFPNEHLVVLFYMQKPCNFVAQLYLPYLRHSRSLFVKSYHTNTLDHGLSLKVHPSSPLLAVAERGSS